MDLQGPKLQNCLHIMNLGPLTAMNHTLEETSKALREMLSKLMPLGLTSLFRFRKQRLQILLTRQRIA